MPSDQDIRMTLDQEGLGVPEGSVRSQYVIMAGNAVDRVAAYNQSDGLVYLMTRKKCGSVSMTGYAVASR